MFFILFLLDSLANRLLKKRLIVPYKVVVSIVTLLRYSRSVSGLLRIRFRLRQYLPPRLRKFYFCDTNTNISLYGTTNLKRFLYVLLMCHCLSAYKFTVIVVQKLTFS